MQNRFKSRVLWVAVLAQIVSVIGLVGGWEAIGITSEVFQGVATAILEILTLLGVLNNPTDGENW